MAEDYYVILGVPKTASQEEIKKAYRNLSKKHHPDVNPDNKDSEDRFKKINEAYSVIGDEGKRKEYDNPVRRDFGGGFPPGFDFFSEFFAPNFNPNRQGRQKSPMKGPDLRVKINFTFEEVLKGAVKTIRYSRNINCSSCAGNGSKNGNSMKGCTNCGGQGIVNQITNTPFGRIQNTVACNLCSGSGRIIHELCNDCSGHGTKEMQEQIAINVPAGITEGFTYRIESAGAQAAGIERPGDLMVLCHIQEDAIYKRLNGNDLHRDVFVSFIDAVIGKEDLRLNVFDEEIRIRLEPKMENGRILRIKGKGLPNQQGQRGDLFLHMNVFVPNDLDESSINALKSVEQNISPDNKHVNYESGVLNRSIRFASMYNGSN